MVVVSRRRVNGEGSIYPYRTGYAAYVWITTPAGRRQRKYVYGKDRETVHEKWLALTQAAQHGPVAPRSIRLADFLARWLVETVQPVWLRRRRRTTRCSLGFTSARTWVRSGWTS